MRTVKPKRFYTNKSHNLKEKVYWFVAIILFPVWIPFYLLSWLGSIALVLGEKANVILDNLLESILAKIIPQIKD